jgi:ATP-binding cassette subfamily F protein 3
VAAVPTLDDVPGRNSSRSGGHAAGNAPQPVNGEGNTEPVVPSSESKGKRLNPIKRKQLEERVHEMEEDIARVETAITHCETSLLTFVSAEESQRQNDELQRRRGELESLLREWEELSQALEAAN